MDEKEAAQVIIDYVKRNSQDGEPFHQAFKRQVRDDKCFQVMYSNYRRLMLEKQKARNK